MTVENNSGILPFLEMPKSPPCPPPESVRLEADDTQQQILLKLDAIMKALGIKNIETPNGKESSNGR
nr:MAG TPA: hypothetical protein [Caudoviricetes sp.]